MNAAELFDFLASLEDSRDAGSRGNGVLRSRLLSGVEYGQGTEAAETKLRAAWRRRSRGGATPLVLIADDPEAEGRLKVLGPQPDGPLRTVHAESLRDLIGETTAMGDLAAVRHLAAEIDRLDTEGVAGLSVRGLGSAHLYGTRLPVSPRWSALTEAAERIGRRTEWRDVLDALGYELTQLPRRGYLARAGGRPALVIHPKRSASEFARLDEQARLPEGALLAECETQGAPYGLLAAGSRLRLLSATGEQAGQAGRYLELDAKLLEPASRPLLGLLAPEYLLEGGFGEIMAEARDHGAELRLRLDRALRAEVLPALALGLGQWARSDRMDLADDEVRSELEAAALTFVFRALFLLYAESAGHLPMDTEAYRQRSLTRIAQRAYDELDSADPDPSLWRDIDALIGAMRTSKKAWGVPAYNGALFAPTDFDGAEILERASIPDAILGPALVALARDPDDPDLGVDFSSLEIGHLGHIYEGLLSLRLSVADRDLRYDERSDRYAPAEGTEADVPAGELLWLTNEGGRKGGGVYYTRSELVRHLIRNSVRPAFAAHLGEIRALAANNPAEAAKKLLDFYVLDPACGSGHFLVEVVDELADQVAELLGELALPQVRDALEELRGTATATLGVEIEDAALLHRLVLKRCVYGVDLSPMGAEIAKVSLWLATFVPGLSLAYLDHNIQVGNSLVGVARADELAPPAEEGGTMPIFDDQLVAALQEAAAQAAKLREIADRTPEEVGASAGVAAELKERSRHAKRVFDLWVAEPLGLDGARREVGERGAEIVAGQDSLLDEQAGRLAREQRALHWPLAFAEVFSRDRPGFDAVVGNPPWEEVNVDELTFYSFFRPGLKALPEGPRTRAIDELLAERPELREMVGAERERLNRLRGSLGPENGYRAGPGNADLFEFFCQRYQRLLRRSGRLGVVLPRSALSTKGSVDFRRWLFDEATPQRVDFLLNNRLWMFDTHPQYTVALLAAENQTATDQDVEVAGVAGSVREFKQQAEQEGLRLKRAALGPELEIPLLPSQAEADLLAKLRSGGPFAYGGGRWRCFPVQGDFNETSDRHLWAEATEGWPIWKGGSFDQFEPHGANARVCPPGEDAMKKACKPRPGSGSLLAKEIPVARRREAVARTVGRARVAFRDVTNRTNSRTVLACLVPPEHFLLNSAPYLTFVDDHPRAEATCLALMNSLAFDWQARRFVETHVNFFILEGLRIPALDDGMFAALADAAARLSCPDDRFAEFAAANGMEPAELPDDERTRLRVEIDARVARAWGLSADELEVVLDDFTIDAVPASYRVALRERYAELG